tara:strand:- start:392 stop:967 length:576 start_codon:yes stop_codon:yes gene_type:complete
MKIKLENLRSLIKEALTETYFGASTVGGLASAAFNNVGPNYEAGVEIPADPVDLANQIRTLIGTDAGYPVGDWGDEALNAAAEAAADALINVNQREKIHNSASLYGTVLDENKKLISEARTVINEIDSDNTAALSNAMEKVIKLLDSIDMSLDLIYGAVSESEGAIMGTRIKQKAFGRALAPSVKRGGEGE